MLMVLAIIGLLTGLTLPFLKGLSRSNTIGSAARQLLDDVSYARHKAIASHTTVFMVFVPPADQAEANIYLPLQQSLPKQWTSLVTGQATSYSFFTRRSLGEQPGEQNPNYVTKWYSLPQGTFIPEYKFYSPQPTSIGPTNDPKIVTPFASSKAFPVPVTTMNGGVTNGTIAYLAFDYMGRLVYEDGTPTMRDEYIPVAQGSIFFTRDQNGGLIWDKADIQENPPGNSLVNYNLIHIDALTGRAKIEQVELK